MRVGGSESLLFHTQIKRGSTPRPATKFKDHS